jgi:opacity protein-like surface antigen
MKKWILAAALAAAAVGAQAQVYVTASGGLSSASVDCGGTSSCDKSGMGFKLLGGYRVMPNVAVEAGYYNLGKFSASGFVSGWGTVKTEWKTAGFGVGAALSADIAPNVNVVGRLALASMSTKVSANIGGSSGSDSESNMAVLLGLGVGYALTKNVSIDATVDMGKHDYAGESGSARVFGLGLTASF